MNSANDLATFERRPPEQQYLLRSCAVILVVLGLEYGRASAQYIITEIIDATGDGAGEIRFLDCRDVTSATTPPGAHRGGTHRHEYSVDGKRIIKDSLSGPQSDAERLGVTLAEKLLKQGADVILREVYGQSPDYSGNNLLEN